LTIRRAGPKACLVTDITDAEVLSRYPDTPIDPDNKFFYKGWLEHRLLMQRCSACELLFHPPAPLCPRCWSTALHPEPVSGRGVVHLLIRLHQGPAAEGVDYTKGPYAVATVELVEQAGLRYTSTVIGCPSEAVYIGMPVELSWIERANAPLPVFQPVTPGATI
jgi:uncharacterized OB-fold protein